MANVTITIKDTENGTVNVEAVFDPPIDGEREATTAQNAAGIMLEALSLVMPSDRPSEADI